eukprot:c24753_g1_i2 orf=463-1335(-)
MGSDDDGGCKVNSSNTCEWSRDEIFLLLDGYGDKFRRGDGLLRNKDWEGLVEYVNAHSEAHQRPKTFKQCQDKVDSLKKRYKMERKRLLGIEVMSNPWPFFAKLDEIAESVPKTVRVRDGPCKQARGGRNGRLTGHVSTPYKSEGVDSSSEEAAAVASFSAEDTENASADGTQEEALKDDLEDSSNEVSESLSPDEKVRVPLDTGSYKHKLEQISESMVKVLAKRRRRLSSHPIQALADAIVGFSDVYARIELAKLEIYTKLQLEMAKSEGGRKRKKRTVPLSLSGSESG